MQAADVLQRLLPHVQQTACAPADRAGSNGSKPTASSRRWHQNTVIDTLVLATGFDLWEANFPAIEVIGREGATSESGGATTRFQAYQGVSMPYFPNYLSLASPYAFLGLNFFNTMEYQMRHMDRLFGEVKRRGATTFEVTEDANTPLPGPDDRADRRFGVHPRELRDIAVLLLRSPAASPPAAPHGDAHGDQRSLRVPVERLSDCVIREEHQLCRKGIRVLPRSPVWPWQRRDWPTSSARSCSSRSPRLHFRATPARHIYINGGIETALGLALAAPKTRRLAAVGAIGYVAYLAGNVARNR